VSDIRVLLVDDEEDMRLVMRVGLNLANEDLVVVGEASDGESALAMADELDPTIVVLDQRMPGLSGLETAVALLERRPGQQMMLCSAFLDDALREEALAAGFGRCIEKNEIPQLPELLRAMAREAA
jgi:two-component system invasion response regulator UvrY